MANNDLYTDAFTVAAAVNNDTYADTYVDGPSATVDYTITPAPTTSVTATVDYTITPAPVAAAATATTTYIVTPAVAGSATASVNYTITPRSAVWFHQSGGVWKPAAWWRQTGGVWHSIDGGGPPPITNDIYHDAYSDPTAGFGFAPFGTTPFGG